VVARYPGRTRRWTSLPPWAATGRGGRSPSTGSTRHSAGLRRRLAYAATATRRVLFWGGSRLKGSLRRAVQARIDGQCRGRDVNRPARMVGNAEPAPARVKIEVDVRGRQGLLRNHAARGDIDAIGDATGQAGA